MKEPLTPEPKISKPEIEQVQQEQTEYYFLGSFCRTRGLSLFGYSSLKDELILVDKIRSTTITIRRNTKTNKLEAYDAEFEKATVDSRMEYFEALNWKTAKKRLEKYKAGKIKQLSNLMPYNPEGIKFF